MTAYKELCEFIQKYKTMDRYVLSILDQGIIHSKSDGLITIELLGMLDLYKHQHLEFMRKHAEVKNGKVE